MPHQITHHQMLPPQEALLAKAPRKSFLGKHKNGKEESIKTLAKFNLSGASWFMHE
jgi:hypothetical protein